MARVASVMALYAMDVGRIDAESAIKSSCDELELPRRWRRQTAKTVHSVYEKRAEIDSLIEKTAIGYTLERIAAVDRALLRVACHEMKFENLPKAVVIDEAVRIAKEFSTEDSGKFVNGILGKVAI
jgi:N utilization substance protein B